MLISSERHTARDLETWGQLESADRTIKINAVLSRSIIEVSKFSKTPCYCSVSWGKDSVVIAWVVARYAPQVPLVWVRPDGAEMPGQDDVRDEFLRRFDVEYFEPTCTAEIWNNPKVSNERAFRPARVATGMSRRIVGVRASESGVRKMSMRHHGLATEQVCRPIGWWSADHVFGCLAQHDLPVHPAYAMLGGGRYDRQHRRVASLGGSWGDSFGRNEWEQEYYPDIINRMKHAASKSNS